MNKRLRDMMISIGYDIDTVDRVCSNESIDHSDLVHMCIVNSYDNYTYPDGYLVDTGYKF